jgi:hypothetical protein
MKELQVSTNYTQRSPSLEAESRPVDQKIPRVYET